MEKTTRVQGSGEHATVCLGVFRSLARRRSLNSVITVVVNPIFFYRTTSPNFVLYPTTPKPGQNSNLMKARVSRRTVITNTV